MVILSRGRTESVDLVVSHVLVESQESKVESRESRVEKSVTDGSVLEG